MISDSDNQDFEIQGFILIDCVDSHREEDAEFYKHVVKIIEKFGTSTSPIINAATGLQMDFDNDRSIRNTMLLYSDHSELHRMMRRGLENNQGELTTANSLKPRMDNEYCFAFATHNEFFYHVVKHLENKITNWLILGRTWNMCVHDNAIGLRHLHKFAPGLGLNFYVMDGGFQKADLSTVTRADIHNDCSLKWTETKYSMYRLKLSKHTGLSGAGYTDSAGEWKTFDWVDLRKIPGRGYFDPEGKWTVTGSE
jgi:hypothetical protein